MRTKINYCLTIAFMKETNYQKNACDSSGTFIDKC